jgi:hypothetical protein
MGISPCDGIVSPAYYVYHVFFVIRLATREVQIAGIVPEPQEWIDEGGGAQPD